MKAKREIFKTSVDCVVFMNIFWFVSENKYLYNNYQTSRAEGFHLEN